jgi:hypothetical protein
MNKFLLGLFILLFQTFAHAYIGPGMGGGALAATLGILLAFILLVFGLLWYPLKRLISRFRKKKR